MKVINQTTNTEPIDAVRPHPRNPRQGDIGAIHTSINANGFYGTIIAQRSTGFILAGNHRWQAARQAGAKTIPVTWIDVDDEHANRILLADNRTNDLADYDTNILTNLLQEIQETNSSLKGTGYDASDLDDLIRNIQNYSPILNPEIALKQHDQDDIDEAARELRERTKDTIKLVHVMCPHCGEEFSLAQ